MRPPATRNFLPEVPDAAKPRPPTFYHTQPSFDVAHKSMFRDHEEALGPLQSIPQPNHGKVSLPMREVNDARTRQNTRGQSTTFDRSNVAAAPPRTLSGLGFDYEARTCKNNYDASQSGVLVD